MDNNRAVLLDILNFLVAVEQRIMGKATGCSDSIERIDFNHCFDIMEKMLKQCESTCSTDDVNEIKNRIKSARETVGILETPKIPNDSNNVYCDLYILFNENKNLPNDDYRSYGKCLGMTNEEFDNLIEEWAEDAQMESQKAVRRKKKTGINTDEDIRGELAKLADSMKSKALWYRDVLVKDNRALSKYTGEQEKQLDTVTHVTQSAKKLERTTQITLKQSIIMVISMFSLTIFMLFIFIIT